MRVTTKKMEKISTEFNLSLTVNRETLYPDGFDKAPKRRLVWTLSAKGKGPTLAAEENCEKAIYNYLKDLGVQCHETAPGGVVVWGS